MALFRLLRATAPLSLLTAATFVAIVIGGGPTGALPAWDVATFTVDHGVRMNSFEARLVQLVNQARLAHGLAALIPTAGTTDVARGWSTQLAAANTLSHNPALVSNLEHAGSANWYNIAENVGVGPADDPDLMFAAYMNSTHHRDNILDPAMRYVGSGVVERPSANGQPTAYHTMDFVDAYNGSYGANRLAASGLRVDALLLAPPSVLGAFGNGIDPRVDTVAAGLMTATTATFDRPGPGSRARFTVAEPYRGTGGYAQFRLKDAYDFRLLGHLTVVIAAATPTGHPVDVTVSLSEPWSTSPNVILGTLKAGPVTRTVTFAIPSQGRTFRNQVVFSVSAASVSALSGVPAGRRATVGVYRITATA